MKRLLFIFVFVFAVPTTAFGGDECSYIGSWLGYNSDGEIAWTSQAVGHSKSSGTMLLELPGFDITFGGVFDVVNATGNLKGVWERTGGNTFSYAGNGIATNSEGGAVYVTRLTGDVAVVSDCDVLEVSNTWLSIYVVDPDNDPIPIFMRDPDVGPLPFAPHNGYRVELELP